MTEHNTHDQSPDRLLKRLVEYQPAVIIPLLFPELAGEVTEELDVEVWLPPERTDRVYKVRSAADREEAIMHIEFEVSANGDADKSLLTYHALLLEKYEMPVLSMLVYPFEVSMVTPPLVSTSGDDELLVFWYHTLALWKLDARVYIEKRAIPLYGLLPAMQGTSEALLLSAIEQIVEHYRHDDARLRDELLCFQMVLTRARRLPEAELLRVEERVQRWLIHASMKTPG